MFAIVAKSIVLFGSLTVLSVVSEKLNITSRIRLQPWPDLKSAQNDIDAFAPSASRDDLIAIHEQLNALLKKVKNFKTGNAKLKSKRCPGLMKAINTADAVERECLVKIIGIPGLSRYYYHTVLSQLARQIGVRFHENDIVMLKRMNAQPNFVDVAEVAFSNISYPVFIKFNNDDSKQAFLRRWSSTLYEKRDQEFLNRMFHTQLTIDHMENTDKIQIHGFRTMGVNLLYQMMDSLTRIINFLNWKSNIVTLYQSRYTKHLDLAGQEQLQTEGIIVKMKSRALKAEWMRQTRLKMLKLPKNDRKIGFVVHLDNHVKYRHRNFTVYIDEHLSTHKKNLFLIARGRCHMKDWLHCWTWDGNVFVRRRKDDDTHRIDTFEDIDSIIV